MSDQITTAAELDALLVSISEWVNGGIEATGEALDLHRTMKVAEESGEVIRAMTGYTGANRRKGITHTRDDVIDELLDTALAALCAVEHMSGHDGHTAARLWAKAHKVAGRAGLVIPDAPASTDAVIPGQNPRNTEPTVAEERARALRDAADAFPGAGFPGTCQGWVMTWLRARAERGEA